MIDFNLLRNRQSTGGISLGRQDPMTDPMYAGKRQFPGQFANTVMGVPQGLRERMLTQPADIVGDRWGLGSLADRLGWFNR